MSGPTVVATILANDEATAKLRAVAAEAEQIQKSVGRANGRMSSEQAAASKEFDKATKQLTAAQNDHLKAIERAHAGLKEMLSTMRSLAAIQIAHVGFEGIKEGAAIQDELIKGRSAGIPDAELKALATQSADIAAQTLNVARAEILKTGTELRAILLKPEEMPALLPDMINAAAALKATGNGGNAEGLQQFAKAAEMMNLTSNPERFHDAVDSFVKASQVFRELLTPETYRKTVAAAGIAAAGWSDRFRNTVFPSLTAEQGERAGTGLNQLGKLVTSGFNNNKAALLEWQRLGLIRADQINSNKGQISLKAGEHPLDYQTAVTDPDKFIQTTIRDAMIKAGITSVEDRISEYRRLFPNSNAAQEAYKLDSQQPLLEKDAANISGAQGLVAAQTALDSATNALSALGVAAKDFLGDLSSPTMADAARAMSALASGIADLGKEAVHLQAEFPGAARAVGTLTLGLTGIAGVKGAQALAGFVTGGKAVTASAARLEVAATALDAAAAALDRAAVAQSAGTAGKAVRTEAEVAAGAAATTVAAASPEAAAVAAGTAAKVEEATVAAGAAGAAARGSTLIPGVAQAAMLAYATYYAKQAADDFFKPLINDAFKAMGLTGRDDADKRATLDAIDKAIPILGRLDAWVDGLRAGAKPSAVAGSSCPMSADERALLDYANSLGKLPQARVLPPTDAMSPYVVTPMPAADAHHAPWLPQTAAAGAAAEPQTVKVDSTVNGTVDGKCQIEVNINSQEMLSGIKRLIQSEVSLTGGFSHGDQGESHTVPSPAHHGSYSGGQFVP